MGNDEKSLFPHAHSHYREIGWEGIREGQGGREGKREKEKGGERVDSNKF